MGEERAVLRMICLPRIDTAQVSPSGGRLLVRIAGLAPSQLGHAGWALRKEQAREQARMIAEEIAKTQR